MIESPLRPHSIRSNWSLFLRLPQLHIRLHTLIIKLDKSNANSHFNYEKLLHYKATPSQLQPLPMLTIYKHRFHRLSSSTGICKTANNQSRRRQLPMQRTENIWRPYPPTYSLKHSNTLNPDSISKVAQQLNCKHKRHTVTHTTRRDTGKTNY